MHFSGETIHPKKNMTNIGDIPGSMPPMHLFDSIPIYLQNYQVPKRVSKFQVSGHTEFHHLSLIHFFVLELTHLSTSNLSRLPCWDPVSE